MDEKDKEQLPEEEAPMSAAMRVLAAKGEVTENPHASQYTGKKVGRLENFWYQHKWHAGLILFAAAVIGVLLWQLITYTAPDVHIMYTGPYGFVGNRYADFEAALATVMEDYNGDGKKAIDFSDNTYLNPAQIAEKKAEQNGYVLDPSTNNGAYSRYQVEISAAKHMLCMLDPALYAEVRDMEGFMPLSEIFGEALPESAVDEYGIRLGDTEFYRENPGVRSMPADTVLAVRSADSPGIGKNEKKLEQLRRHMDLLRAIAEYTAEE